MKTMNRIGKGIVGAVVSLALVFGMIPGMSMTSYAATWSSDQLIDADTTIDDGVTLKNSITLTINEGVTLTVNGGISGNKTLYVVGGGTLVVNGANGTNGSSGKSGGMGGNAFTGNLYVREGSTVTLTGGRGGNGFDATSSANATSGGMGGYGVNGMVTVNDGSATIIGGSGGTGGAGANNRNGGNGGSGGMGIGSVTTIYDGPVTIIGGNGGNGGAQGTGTSQAGSAGSAGASVRQNSNLTLGENIILYEGTDNTGTVLDNNTGASRSYSGTRPQSMYAEVPSASGETTVTWDTTVVSGIRIDSQSTPFSKDDITLSCSGTGATFDSSNIMIMQDSGLNFVTSAGNFTRIEIACVASSGRLPDGWSRSDANLVWEGSSNSVSLMSTGRPIMANNISSITFTLEPAGDPMTVTATGFEGDYDGEPHRITVTVTEPALGYEIKYGTVEGTYDLDESPTYTDVGTHTVYYQVTATGYATATGSAIVAIDPVSGTTVTWDTAVVNSITLQQAGDSYEDSDNGITVTQPGGNALWNQAGSRTNIQFYSDDFGAGTYVFECSSGNFSKIEILASSIEITGALSDGWAKRGASIVWTGSSNSVTLTTTEMVSLLTVSDINFTMEPTGGETTVTWDSSVLSNIALDYWGEVFEDSENGITVTQDGHEGSWINDRISFDEDTHFVFESSNENFTQIVIHFDHTKGPTSYGSDWTLNDDTLVWNGSSNQVDLCSIYGYIYGITGIDFVFGSSATKTMTVSAEDVNVQYDGDPHSITVVATDAVSGEEITGTTVLYRTNPDASWSSDVPAVTDVGSQTVYYQVSADGYTPAEGSATITVIEGNIQYNAIGCTTTYDGQPHSILVTVTTPSEGADIQYRYDDVTTWSSENPTFTTGTHTVYFQISAPNYTTTDIASETVTINNATIDCSVSGYTGTYDGDSHGISFEFRTPSESDVEILYRTNPNEDWTSTVPTRTDVGTTTVYYQISATGYNTIEDSRNIVIGNGTMSVTSRNYSGTYDGQAHGITVTVNTPSEGATIEYSTNGRTWQSTPITRTDVTSRSVTVYWRVTAPNYNTASGQNTITINNADLPYSAPNVEVTYDGNPHTIEVTPTTLTQATIRYRDDRGRYSLSTPPTRTDAGSTTVYFQISATNYTTVYGSATVTVKPAQIVCSAEGYSGTYNGTAHSITVNVTKPTSGATIRYRVGTGGSWSTNNPTFTAAGTYVVYYEVSARNYETTEVYSATVEITPATMTVTATGHTGTWDGTEYGIAVTVSEPTSGYQIRYGMSADSCTSRTSPTFSDAGTYTVYYRVTAPNYNDATGSEVIQIDPATMTVTATGYSAPYDGAAHGIEVRVTTPSSGATILYGESADACTLTTCPTYSYGEHTIYYRVTAPNYNDATGSATVSISNIDIVAEAEGFSGEYDGDAHGITVTVSEPATGATVAYGLEEGSYPYSSSPTFTNAGDYTVYFLVTAEGHNDFTGSAAVNIGALTIDATVEGYDGVYDESDHGISITVNTPESGATVSYGTEEGSYPYSSSPTFTEVGTYTVFYQIEAANYATVTGSATVSISENPDRRSARERLTDLVGTTDDVLDEWEELLPEDLVEELKAAQEYAEDVLSNESATTTELSNACAYLGGILERALDYIDYYYGDDEPSLTPEQRRMLSIENFVESLYLNALGRTYDLAGRDSWVSVLVDQNQTGTYVARGFLGSAEFIGFGLDDEAFVRTLYAALYNRIPTDAEVKAWTAALAAGTPRGEVIDSFLSSPEWADVCAYYCVNV